MWLIIALCATLCWSGSDFFSKLGSKPSDKYSHWKMVIAVGDQVLYGKYAGTELQFEGESYLIMKQNDILAIVD